MSKLFKKICIVSCLILLACFMVGCGSEKEDAEIQEVEFDGSSLIKKADNTVKALNNKNLPEQDPDNAKENSDE